MDAALAACLTFSAASRSQKASTTVVQVSSSSSKKEGSPTNTPPHPKKEKDQMAVSPNKSRDNVQTAGRGDACRVAAVQLPTIQLELQETTDN